MWVPPEEKDPIVRHYPGRQSVGYYGAVRLRDGKLVFLREENKFDGESYFQFLKLLRSRSYQSNRKVFLIVDNARYHHARIHKKWRNAKDNVFHCEFLPPYSPDLNPIERVWKLTRRKCVHNKYFPTLNDIMITVEKQFSCWEKPNIELKRLCKL